jgi:hypothetical protein
MVPYVSLVVVVVSLFSFVNLTYFSKEPGFCFVDSLYGSFGLCFVDFCLYFYYFSPPTSFGVSLFLFFKDFEM